MLWPLPMPVIELKQFRSHEIIVSYKIQAFYWAKAKYGICWNLWLIEGDLRSLYRVGPHRTHKINWADGTIVAEYGICWCSWLIQSNWPQHTNGQRYDWSKLWHFPMIDSERSPSVEIFFLLFILMKKICSNSNTSQWYYHLYENLSEKMFFTNLCSVAQLWCWKHYWLLVDAGIDYWQLHRNNPNL